jgi:DNA polymerase-3 subunit gamma/tau
LNDLANQGKDLGRLVSDLLNHFRNLLLFEVSGGDLTILEVSEAEVAALKAQSRMAGAEGLTRIMEVLADAEMRLRDAASKKILVEVALLKVIEARSAVSIDSLLQQLQALRAGKAGEAAGPSAPAAAASAKPASALARAAAPGPVPRTQPSTPPQPIGAPLEELSDLWARLVEAVGRASPFTRTYLLEAHPVSFQKNVLTIGFDPEVEDHLGLVDNARNHTLLQTKLLELGHPNAQIKFIKAEAPASPTAPPAEPPAAPPPGSKSAAPRKSSAAAKSSAAPAATAKEKLAPVPFSKDDFKDDPLIQKALEIFKGQIVDVRA